MKCPNCNQVLYSDNLKNCPFCGKEIPQKANNDNKIKANSFPKNYRMEPSNPVKTPANSVPVYPKLKEPRNQEAVPKKYSETGTTQNAVHTQNIAPEMTKKEQQKTNVNVEEKSNFQDNVNKPTENFVSSSTPSSIPASVEIPLETRIVNHESTNPVKGVKPQEEYENEEKENEPSIEVVSEKKKKGLFAKKKSKTEKDEKPEKGSKKKRKLFSKKKEQEESLNSDDSEEIILEETDDENEPDNEYDVNYDGYYDDLIPELAHQINKIPQENIVKVIMIIIFMIVGSGLILYFS